MEVARAHALHRPALFPGTVYHVLPPRLWVEEEAPGGDGAVRPDSSPLLR